MTLTKLEKLLLFGVLELAPSSNEWASKCRAALLPRIRDKDYRRTCLGAVFRRAAIADPGWFLEICGRLPSEVLDLSPYITPENPRTILRLADMHLAANPAAVLGPGNRYWASWIDAVAMAKNLDAATPLSEAERQMSAAPAVKPDNEKPSVKSRRKPANIPSLSFGEVAA